jgi:S1-C subfamily serine protease
MREPSVPSPDLKHKSKAVLARLRPGVPFVSGMVAACLAFSLYSAVFVKPFQLTESDVDASIAEAMASATPQAAYSSIVYEIIRPSLMLIEVEREHEGEESDFGLGSGVIVDNFGNILTSLHVVQGASRIKVTFADGFESDAEIVMEQPENDIAVLQAHDTPLVVTPAVLGNPGSMRVGDEAFAVGNPFGLYGSMTSGVISGFNRTFIVEQTGQEIEGLIQIDTAVNPGNSGGPLLNRSGHVVGIITGLLNPTDGNFFVGIGFAVPITTAVGGMGSPPY